MTKIVLVLTGEGSPSKLGRYSAGLALSTMTAKHFHPDVPVVCAGDDYARCLLDANPSRVADFVDAFIPCPDAAGGPVHRSRAIKTSLRQRVRGPFVYMDTDTALVGNIAPLLACESPLGITLDSWFTDSVGEFPRWCHKVYRDLGWTYPTAWYYNSGVMFVDDSPDTAALFREWQVRYAKSVAHGINLDQPAFNSAAQHLAMRAEVFPEDYNFFCGKSPRAVPPSARILHACCSLPATTIPAYEDAVRSLLGGSPVDATEIVSALRAARHQTLRDRHFLWDMRRRVVQFMRRGLCRMGLASARER